MFKMRENDLFFVQFLVDNLFTKMHAGATSDLCSVDDIGSNRNSFNSQCSMFTSRTIVNFLRAVGRLDFLYNYNRIIVKSTRLFSFCYTSVQGLWLRAFRTELLRAVYLK